MNVRVIRLAVIVLLRAFIDNIKDYNEFDLFLKRMSEENVLSENWIENLVQLVLLMLLYMRAERKGELSLHLLACKTMTP